jgi:hypothetical protein
MKKGWQSNYRDDFSGGVNLYFGSRQISDKESPDAVNCDFKGKSGVGNRQGYSEVGAVADSRTKIYGLNEFHTSALDQLIKFASNGANIELYYSTGGAWTEAAGTTFTNAINMDSVQAGSALYTGNGTDAMKHWSGAAWGTTTNGTIGYYPEYFDKALWVVDETSKDTINVSGQWAAASSKLGDFTYADPANLNAQTIQIKPGSGVEIRGLKNWKNAIWAFCYPFGIYKITTTTTANTYSVELITNAVGCVSHRSIAQVGEDLFFAADDGVYSLGDVANYTAVRTTNRSAKVQRIFDAMTGSMKIKLCAEYYNFKYHLFYSDSGTENTRCAAYDIRYKAWQDWTNMPANDVTLYTDGSDEQNIYFGEPSTGQVNKMYDGTTDDGDSVSSYWYSKSFTEDVPDTLKLYYDSTFMFGAINGSVNISVIFDDTITSATKTLSQNKPQGGCGRDACGVVSAGDATNTETITIVVNTPQRLKAKGKKFSIQYKIASTNDWRLDSISQYFMPMDHFAYPSANKLN